MWTRFLGPACGSPLDEMIVSCSEGRVAAELNLEPATCQRGWNGPYHFGDGD